MEFMSNTPGKGFFFIRPQPGVYAFYSIPILTLRDEASGEAMNHIDGGSFSGEYGSGGGG
jgi:hypothetical protein